MNSPAKLDGVYGKDHFVNKTGFHQRSIDLAPTDQPYIQARFILKFTRKFSRISCNESEI